jgi:hypothetical protein
MKKTMSLFLILAASALAFSGCALFGGPQDSEYCYPCSVYDIERHRSIQEDACNTREVEAFRQRYSDTWRYSGMDCR